MHTTYFVRSAAAAAALALTFSVSACSGKSEGSRSNSAQSQESQGPTSSATTPTEKAPTAKEAWSKAQARINSYTSWHIKSTGSSIALDEYGETKGTSYGMKLENKEGRAEAIRIGNRGYIKGNKAYYQQTSSSKRGADTLVAQMADVWIVAPVHTNETPIKYLIRALGKKSNNLVTPLTSPTATVTPDRVDGQDAWKITADTKKISAWVTRDGNFDLLKVEGLKLAPKGSSRTVETLIFSEHDKKFHFTAPPGAKSVREIMGGTSGQGSLSGDGTTT